MNISNKVLLYKKDSWNKMKAILKLINDILRNEPVFLEYKCPYTSVITKLLVVPEYFYMGYLYCTLLTVDHPEVLKYHPSSENKADKINIDIDSILSWEAVEEKAFLDLDEDINIPEHLNMVVSV